MITQSEYFFYEDKFISDVEDLLYELNLDENDDDSDIKNLPDDWSVVCEESKHEKMFQFKIDDVVSDIISHTDRFEERFPEESERVFKELEVAVKNGIDIDKINSEIPKLYYPSGVSFTITKNDLLEYFKIT